MQVTENYGPCKNRLTYTFLLYDAIPTWHGVKKNMSGLVRKRTAQVASFVGCIYVMRILLHLSQQSFQHCLSQMTCGTDPPHIFHEQSCYNQQLRCSESSVLQHKIRLKSRKNSEILRGKEPPANYVSFSDRYTFVASSSKKRESENICVVEFLSRQLGLLLWKQVPMCTWLRLAKII